MTDDVIRTITIRGSSEGLDKLTADIKKLAAAEQGLAVVSDDLTKSQLSLEQQLKRQTLRLDETARAQANIDREIRLSERGVKQKLKTDEEHARTIELVNQRYGAASTATQTLGQHTANLTKQTSRNTAEMLNLSRQVADVGVSLQAGQSLLTVGIQQGAQILDVFASSGRSVGQIFGQAATMAGRFVTSTAGVVTGIAAIGAAAVYAGVSWQDGQREIDRALIGVGKRAGLTRDEINQMADTTAKASRLSSSELRGTALELIKTGTIYGENIGKINSLVEGFAIQTGQSAQEAGKALAEIFGGDIVQGADKLNAIYGNLSGRMRQYIVDLDSSGQRQKAIAVLADEAAKKTKESADAVGFWARSWQLLGQAASGAFDAMGKGMTNLTGIGETRLAALQARLNFLKEGLKEQEQRSAGGGVGVDTERLERSRAAVKALTDEIAKFKKESGDISQLSVAEKIGLDADDAVRKLLQFIEPLDKVRKAQKQIADAQATPGANQGLAEFNKQAADAAKVLELNLMAAADQQKRMNANALELAFIYNTQNIGVAKTLDALTRQLPVAQAVGGMAQIEAQYKARVAELSQSMDPIEARRIANAERLASLAQIEAQHKQTMIQLQGQLDVASQITGIGQINAQYEATVNLLSQQIPLSMALEQAELQRATAIAQVNANAERTLNTLQQENELINASSDSERDRIKSRQTYENLKKQGVSSDKASAVASQQLQNAEDERARAYERMTSEQKKQHDLAQMSDYNRETAMRKEAQAQAAAAAAARDTSAWLETAAEAAERIERAMFAFVAFGPDIKNIWGTGGLFQTNKGGVGSWSQFDPKGYTSQTPQTAAAMFAATAMYGEGGFTQDPALASLGFLQPIPNAQGLETLVNRGGTAGTLLPMLSSANTDLVSAAASLLSRMNDLLPDDQKAAAIQQQLDVLGTPTTLAGQELVKRLKDELTRLTEATQENTSATSAMTDVLSPFYSSDPRRTHLGFRAFAGGGIMTQFGELPLRHYQTGGMANSPQVAVFGEGSTPEAYVPVPSGRIPVEIKSPANSNQRQRPVNVNIYVQGNADQNTVAAMKSTAFQQAQAMRRVMG